MSLVKSISPSAKVVQPFQFLEKANAPTIEEVDSEGTGAQNAELKPAINAGSSPQKAVAKESHFLDRIADLEEALKAREKELEEARKKAFDEGQKTGEAAASRKSEEALALLGQAAEQGVKSLEAKLDGQIETSVEIARALLRRILGDEAELPWHVAETARRWKSEIAGSSLIRLRVSAEDFPDESELADLAKSFAGTEILAEADLARGSCLFDLKLGTLDASISRQLDNAEALLDQPLDDGGDA